MKKALGAMAVLLLCAAPAMADLTVADLVTPDGSHFNINGLESYPDSGNPLRLFEPPSSDPVGGPPPVPTDTWWHNNRSPLAGSGYPDYVPSPGENAAGEAFDIEGLFWDYDAGTLQVWVVTSIGPTGAVFTPDPDHPRK